MSGHERGTDPDLPERDADPGFLTALADPARAGVRFAAAPEAERAATAAAELHFAVGRAALAGSEDRRAALAAIAAALRFPDWFGLNLDALADSLRDMSWWEAPGYLLLLDGAGGWRDSDSEGFQAALDILGEAAAEWADLGVPFWTVAVD